MNKYLVFRCGKCIWKNTKSHELIGVEMAEDIDDERLLVPSIQS